MRLYMGLLHYPVYNKNHERIASALTTLDIHDLSRLARTYGVKRFYVVTPLTDQQGLALKLLRHWTTGYGARYNPCRKEALELATVVASLEESVKDITSLEGEKPLLIATDASELRTRCLSYSKAMRILGTNRVAILVFGTAWGLDREVIDHADYQLEPIKGVKDYNHLSVRAAAAIILDRVVGRGPFKGSGLIGSDKTEPSIPGL
jgi:tRNA (guanine37-N1)-methyltransferase